MTLIEAEYVLPLSWDLARSRQDAAELAGYLRQLAALIDVTVVDGSDAVVFARHHRLWGPGVRHVRPDPRPGANGKVAGVVTGVGSARHARVIIADDDVRYDAAVLHRMVHELNDADVVRPQCVYDRLSWSAQWDTARMLINRCFSHDHPGTYGLRKAVFLAAGGYDGDAMFENLEMTRTMTAHGAVVVDRPDLFVTRIAPTARQFWRQRTRHAYDDLAQPARLAAELALLPALLGTAMHDTRLLLFWFAGSVAAAERGRHRYGGRRVFPAICSAWAPIWVAERSVCVWLAVAQRLAGGTTYRGRRVRLAAHSTRTLRHGCEPGRSPLAAPAPTNRSAIADALEGGESPV